MLELYPLWSFHKPGDVTVPTGQLPPFCSHQDGAKTGTPGRQGPGDWNVLRLMGGALGASTFPPDNVSQ